MKIDPASNEVSGISENVNLEKCLIWRIYKVMWNYPLMLLLAIPASWSNELTVNAGSENKVASTMLVVEQAWLSVWIKWMNILVKISLLTNKNNENISVRIQSAQNNYIVLLDKDEKKKSAFIVSQLNNFRWDKRDCKLLQVA